MMTAYVYSFNEYIFEGGWANIKTQETKITPQVIVDCVELINIIFKDFKKYTSSKNFPELVHKGPVGSGKYYLQDLKEDPEHTYGDIDTAVEYPILKFEDISGREAELKTAKIYRELLLDFLKIKNYKFIDYDATVSVSPSEAMHFIMSPKKDSWVQVDLIIMYEGVSDWSINRFTPERNYKGFTIGGLYTALGDSLVLSMGARGVIAKFQKEILVSQKIKKDTHEQVISINYGEFLMDTAVFFSNLYKKTLVIDKLLETNKGMNQKSVTIEAFCLGIKGLALTFEKTGLFKTKMLNYIDAKDFMQQVREKYHNCINSQLTSTKFDKAQSELAMLAIEKVKKHAAYGIEIVNKTLK